MELESIKQQYVQVQTLLNSPDLFLGKTQSLLEQLLKLNYKKVLGKNGKLIMVEWMSL